ncbi:MAG: hypothetical protein WAM66_09825 [Acidobacteriaceae bacterium]
MYLSKQWRESRILSGIAVLALILLLFLAVKAGFAVDTVHVSNDNRDGFRMLFIPLFYIEAILVAFWGWLAAGIGVGKNLGEESGSFLLTRPRRRAWFLWSDWGYAMVQIAAIIVLANLMIGFLLAHILGLLHRPESIQLADHAQPISLFAIMALVSVGVLLFAGLIYGLTYFSTIVLRRAAGVMLGAGILVAYLILRGLIAHYYPSVQLPNLIPNLFNFNHNSFYGLSNNIGWSLLARAAVMMAFPVAAQFILDRSEI